MRTGVAFSTIINEVKLEAKETTNATQATSRDPYIKQIINREYRWLGQQFRWPLRHSEVEVSLVALTKTYTFPATLNPAHINEVWYQIGTTWLPLPHVIGRLDRSVFDDSNPSWPPQRFEFQPDTGTGTFTFEVWPVPSEAGKLRFSGQQKITDLVNNGDVCVIDADVLVLRAASQILLSKEPQLAAIKAAQAEKRAADIVKKMTTGIGRPLQHGRRRVELVPWEDYIPPGQT